MTVLSILSGSERTKFDSFPVFTNIKPEKKTSIEPSRKTSHRWSIEADEQSWIHASINLF